MKEYLVQKWVYDKELEEVLNTEGYRPYRLFRNAVGNNCSPETTTVILKRDNVVEWTISNKPHKGYHQYSYTGVWQPPTAVAAPDLLQ